MPRSEVIGQAFQQSSSMTRLMRMHPCIHVYILLCIHASTKDPFWPLSSVALEYRSVTGRCLVHFFSSVEVQVLPPFFPLAPVLRCSLQRVALVVLVVQFIRLSIQMAQRDVA